MLHGKGAQNFLSKATEEDIQSAMRDRKGYTENELLALGITESQGMGMTNEKTYQIKQFPFPVDSSIKTKVKVDIRKVKPEIGEMSD